MTSGVNQSTLTVQAVARRYGVAADTVRAWIQASELAAFNASREAKSKKPQWRILPSALEDFEQRRSPAQPARPRKRQRRAVLVGEPELYK